MHAILCAALLSGLAALPDSGEKARALKDLKSDINLLNLLNGLHLTPEQRRGLLAVHRRLAKLRPQGVSPAAEAAARKRRIEALREIRDRLLAGREVPRDLLRRSRRPIDPRGPGYAKTKERAFAAAKRAAVGEVFDLLRPDQREVLVTYKSCLIPPRNLRDPVRVGQASDSSFGRRILERIRRLPPRALRAGPRAVAERIVARIAKAGGGLTPEQYREALRFFTDIVPKVRAMDDLEFSIQLEDLARKVEVFNRHHETRRILQETLPEASIRKNIAAFLLDPRIPRLLDERTKLELPPLEGDLDAVPEAESCDDGSCALPPLKHRRRRRSR